MRRYRYLRNWIAPLYIQVKSFSFLPRSHVNRRRAIFHIPFQTIRRSRVPRRQLAAAIVIEETWCPDIARLPHNTPILFPLLRGRIGAYVYVRPREFHKNCKEKGG